MLGCHGAYDLCVTPALVQRYDLAGGGCLTTTAVPGRISSGPRAAIVSPDRRSPNTSTSGPDARPVRTSIHSVRPLAIRTTNVRPVVLVTLALGTSSDGPARRTGQRT